MGPKIPERIARIEELANNIWWSWHEEARQLFRTLDYPLWRKSDHNPVQELEEVTPERLQAAASDPTFLAFYNQVMANFDAEMNNRHTWFDAHYPQLLSGPVAYFSMEYAFHNSLPIYAGGLGAMAGDICKEASDMGLPLVAVGFMYPQGYFHQHISPDGHQEEIYQQLYFNSVPIKQVRLADGGAAIARVKIANITLAIAVWLVKVGRTRVYLLDTNLEENPPDYRQLSVRLYTADQETRIQQEVILGIGGVRVLRALGIRPRVWHANEGHTSFMMLERVREEVAGRASFADAVGQVQTTTVFTTHTPVLAGHDIFPADLMEKYFSDYWLSLGIDRETFLNLGQHSASEPPAFNMAALGMRLANQRNAVSQLHEGVARRMWHGLWPEASEDQVPITHVTNGVHVPGWVGLELQRLLDQYLGQDWLYHQDDPKLWARLQDIPDSELWGVHQQMKRKLVGAIRERLRGRWMEDDVSWRQMMAMGAVLDPEALTIAFTRRFAEYKRPALILRDTARLKNIINNEFYPVQLIFAGKSHPADLASKYLLQQVYTTAADREFQGRIVFVEDYDMRLAHYLSQGVDVWLNNPRRLQEACGTSGMKAALNGVPSLSVRDGWWHEGYNGQNGWAIGELTSEPADEDAADAESLYCLLEEIIPLYYDRDLHGVPRPWLRLMKETMRSIAPGFSARRMLKEYTERMYRSAAPPPASAGDNR